MKYSSLQLVYIGPIIKGGGSGLVVKVACLPRIARRFSNVERLCDRAVVCSFRNGSNFDLCVWRAVSSDTSHYPQNDLLAKFSLYLHKRSQLVNGRAIRFQRMCSKLFKIQGCAVLHHVCHNEWWKAQCRCSWKHDITLKNVKDLFNVVLILANRLRRWPSIKTILNKWITFVRVIYHLLCHLNTIIWIFVMMPEYFIYLRSSSSVRIYIILYILALLRPLNCSLSIWIFTTSSGWKIFI